MTDNRFIDARKPRLAWLAIRVCALSILLFGSFTASLYLPHDNIWWRISEGILIGMMFFATIQTYRGRKRISNRK